MLFNGAYIKNNKMYGPRLKPPKSLTYLKLNIDSKDEMINCTIYSWLLIIITNKYLFFKATLKSLILKNSKKTLRGSLVVHSGLRIFLQSGGHVLSPESGRSHAIGPSACAPQHYWNPVQPEPVTAMKTYNKEVCTPWGRPHLQLEESP